jgi:hypothetical protein
VNGGQVVSFGGHTLVLWLAILIISRFKLFLLPCYL